MIDGRTQTHLRFLGSNVHRFRVRAGLTQEDLEELSGLDVRFIRRVERGSVNMRFDTLIRLARALDVEPARLLREVAEHTPTSGRPPRKRKPSTKRK